MKFFVDESGTFCHSPSRSHSISCVGVLCIPDGSMSQIFKRYARIRAKLPLQNGEVKGRSLKESQIASLIDMLKKNDVLFEVTAVDLNLMRDADIADHQYEQADNLIANLTEKHHPDLKMDLESARSKLLSLAPQLYVQSVAAFEVVWRAFQHAVLYYSMRQPNALGEFEWIIDGKDRKKVTEWELWWSSLAPAFMQSRSFRDPLIMLKGADYSSFRNFHVRMPDYLKPHLHDYSQDSGTDVGAIWGENVHFVSTPEPGLEIVDILTNAARRALSGNLRIDGWKNLSSLIVKRRTSQAVQIILLGHRSSPLTSPSYTHVIKTLDERCKPLLPDTNQYARGFPNLPRPKSAAKSASQSDPSPRR